jgi:hypothetical protein
MLANKERMKARECVCLKEKQERKGFTDGKKKRNFGKQR